MLARFEDLDDVTIVSEEVGHAGDGGSTYVVVDPIDGSLNAKRGIGFFSLSIAVASGPTMGDVHFGFVHDFGTEEEWTAQPRRRRAPERTSARRRPAEGADRDPLLRGDAHRVGRGEGRRGRRPRLPPADHGLARAVALPSRRRARRRRLLAEAGALGRHRCRSAARARARARDRPLRGAAVRRGSARRRGAFTGRRSGNAELCRQLAAALSA